MNQENSDRDSFMKQVNSDKEKISMDFLQKFHNEIFRKLTFLVNFIILEMNWT